MPGSKSRARFLLGRDDRRLASAYLRLSRLPRHLLNYYIHTVIDDRGQPPASIVVKKKKAHCANCRLVAETGRGKAGNAWDACVCVVCVGPDQPTLPAPVSKASSSIPSREGYCRVLGSVCTPYIHTDRSSPSCRVPCSSGICEELLATGVPTRPISEVPEHLVPIVSQLNRLVGFHTNDGCPISRSTLLSACLPYLARQGSQAPRAARSPAFHACIHSVPCGPFRSSWLPDAPAADMRASMQVFFFNRASERVGEVAGGSGKEGSLCESPKHAARAAGRQRQRAGRLRLVSSHW